MNDPAAEIRQQDDFLSASPDPVCRNVSAILLLPDLNISPLRRIRHSSRLLFFHPATGARRSEDRPQTIRIPGMKPRLYDGNALLWEMEFSPDRLKFHLFFSAQVDVKRDGRLTGNDPAFPDDFPVHKDHDCCIGGRSHLRSRPGPKNAPPPFRR